MHDYAGGGGFDLTRRTLQPEVRKEHAKRGLLVAAASQNYQRCYKALKALETYWAGARYIVTVLDQKAKGSLDPLLYTAEYLGGASESQAVGALLPAPARRPSFGAEPHSGALSDSDHHTNLAKLKYAVGPCLETLHGSKGTEASQGKTSNPILLEQ